MDACAEFPFTNSISQAMTPSSVLTRFVDFNETEDVDKAMKKQGEKGVTISYNQPKGDKGKDGKGKDGKGKGKDGKGKAGFIWYLSFEDAFSTTWKTSVGIEDMRLSDRIYWFFLCVFLPLAITIGGSLFWLSSLPLALFFQEQRNGVECVLERVFLVLQKDVEYQRIISELVLV